VQHRRDNKMLVEKLQGFQDPNTSHRTADQFLNVDHVLVGNGTASFLSRKFFKILPAEIALVVSFIRTFLRFKFNSTERIPARELVLTSTVDRRLLINSPRVLEALSVSNVTMR